MVHHTLWIVNVVFVISEFLKRFSKPKCKAPDYSRAETWTILEMQKWRSLRLLKCGYGENWTRSTEATIKQTRRCCNWCKRRVQWSTHSLPPFRTRKWGQFSRETPHELRSCGGRTTAKVMEPSNFLCLNVVITDLR